jgi:hypothetical protein
MLPTQLSLLLRRLSPDNSLQLNILPDSPYFSISQVPEDKSPHEIPTIKNSNQVFIFQYFACKSIFRRDLAGAHWGIKT